MIGLSGRTTGAVVLAVVLVSTVPPTATLATARATTRVTSNGEAAARPDAATPAVPSTGHFHALRTPARVVSRSFAAGSALTVAIAGDGGLPAHGIRAVALTVTASSRSGLSQLWVGRGAKRPSIPTLEAGKGTTSGFAIVPLPTSGRVRIWNGAHQTRVAVDVTGWFSAKSEAGTGGLFTRLAGRQVATLKVPAHKARSLRLVGKQDVPTKDVRSLLVRIRTAGAKRAGQVGIGSGSSAAAHATSLAYGVGSSEDLAVAAVSHAGKVVVRNSGSTPVTVSLDAMGWFSAGTDKHAFGDVLSVARGAKVLSGRRVGGSAIATKVTQAGGIPTVGAGAAPTLVLISAVASAPTKSGSLTVEPDHASATRFSSLALRVHAPRAGLELALPGATNQSVWRDSAGHTTVSAQSYAWFSGGTVVAKGVQVLSSAVAAQVTAIDASGVTFSGTPAALSGLKVGDILVAAPTAQTPRGLLRTVTGIAASGGNLVVSTTPATVHDAIAQGTLAVGASASAPNAPTLGTHKTAALPAGGHVVHPSISTVCSVSGAPTGIGATITCHKDYNPPGASIHIEGSAGVSISIDASISLFSGVHVASQTEVSTSASASVDATGQGSASHTFDLGHLSLGEVVVDIAGVPIVLFPYFAPQIVVNATYDAGLTGSAEIGASFGVSYDSDNGFSWNHQAGGSGSGAYNGQAQVAVRGTFVGALVVFIDSDPWATPSDDTTEQDCDVNTPKGCEAEAAISVDISPYGEVDADQCSIRASAGLSINLGAKLSVIDVTILDLSHSFKVGSAQLFEHNLTNCALWSGQILFKAQEHQSNPELGTLGTFDLASRSEATLATPRFPPIDDIYGASVSGSGAWVAKTPFDTGCGGHEHVTIDTRRDNWGGKITQSGEPLTFGIEDAGGGRYALLQYVDGVLDEAPAATAAGTNVDKISDGPPSDPCAVQTTTTKEPHDEGSAGVFGLIAPPALEFGAEMLFKLAAGQMHVHKVVETAPGDNAAIPAYTVTLDLTKRCSKGGTHC